MKITIIAFISFLSFCSIELNQLSFINSNSGDLIAQDQPDFTKEQLEFAAALIEGVSQEEIDALDGAKLFKSNCSSCHGRKGGLGLGGATNLKKSEIDITHRVAMIYYGKGKMQAYGEQIDPTKLVALAQYVETLRK